MDGGGWRRVPLRDVWEGLTNERSLGKCGGQLVGEFFNFLIY